jgi:hypothetical protein
MLCIIARDEHLSKNSRDNVWEIVPREKRALVSPGFKSLQAHYHIFRFSLKGLSVD